MCAQITSFPIETQPLSDVVLLKADNLAGLANNAAARSNLGLGTAATQASTAFDPAGAAAAITLAGLGAGTAATHATGDFMLAGSGITNPMTTQGDIIVGGSSGSPGRLAIGTPGQFVKVNAGATGLEYGTPSGAGNVVGPTSATASRLALFDGTTGKLLKDSSTLAVSGGTVTGSSSVTVAAGGTDQDIVVIPSGDGVFAIGNNTTNTYADFRSKLEGQGFFTFWETVTPIWQFGKQVDNTFVIYNNAASGYAFIISTALVIQFPSYGAGMLITDSSGHITASSDATLKDILSDYTPGMDALRGVQPKNFKWKDTSGMETSETYSGLIAQNVMDNIPEAVDMGRDGKLTIQDRTVVATLINAVNELDNRLAHREAQMLLLSQMIEDLRKDTKPKKSDLDALIADLSLARPPDDGSKAAKAAAKLQRLKDRESPVPPTGS